MKRVTIVSIMGGDSRILSELYQQFKDKIPKEFSKYQYNEGLLNLPLNPDSEELHKVLEIANKNNLGPKLFNEVYYTKKEVEDFNYFQMRILSPLEKEGTEASDYGTSYEGGCLNPNCRRGKMLVGDILVDRKLMKKWDIGSLRPDIYVSENLKDLICSNGLTGVSFNHEVKDFKGREMKKFYIMEFHHVLPPMSSSAWLIKSESLIYKECGHHTLYLRSDLQYESEKLDSALDFNLSNEYVDTFREREIIVSNKVRKLFKQHKTHAGFIPIAII